MAFLHRTEMKLCEIDFLPVKFGKTGEGFLKRRRRLFSLLHAAGQGQHRFRPGKGGIVLSSEIKIPDIAVRFIGAAASHLFHYPGNEGVFAPGLFIKGRHNDHRIFQPLGLMNIQEGHLSRRSIGFFILVLPYSVLIPQPQVTGKENIHILQRFLAIAMIFLCKAVETADESGNGGKISGFIAFSCSSLIQKSRKRRKGKYFISQGQQIFRQFLFSFHFSFHRTNPLLQVFVPLHHVFCHGEEKNIGPADSLCLIHNPVLP